MKKILSYFTLGLLGLIISLSTAARTVVTIDVGHGGKDPGTTGKNLGLKEKEVTLAIAKELKSLLDSDPHFRAVMTRSSDSFIPLPDRTEIARKNRSNYLVSIHADASPNSTAMKGASVWVLSNRRANDEMGKWLEEIEKQSELLGGAGSILSSNNERYLNQTVLDLQFSHSQRSGYELGKTLLSSLGRVTNLAKTQPQHASLSVLRSPDITSALVEVGFLSNTVEEQKLANPQYRRQIARAIYNGLSAYRKQNLRTSETKGKTAVKEEKNVTTSTPAMPNQNKPDTVKSTPDAKSVKKEAIKKEATTKETSKKDNVKKDNAKKEIAKKENETKVNKEKTERKLPQKSNTGYHLVQQDETLYSIARVYGTTPEKLSKLNNIKNNQIFVGKKLKVQ